MDQLLGFEIKRNEDMENIPGVILMSVSEEMKFVCKIREKAIHKRMNNSELQFYLRKK